MNSLLSLVVDALATYRLTKLVTEDKVTEDLRDRVHARYGEPDSHKVSYLVTCPWCVSVYLGFAVALCRNIVPGPWSVVGNALAFSAVTGLMAEREEQLTIGF